MTKKQIIEKRQQIKWELEGLQFQKEMSPRNFANDLQEKLTALEKEYQTI